MSSLSHKASSISALFGVNQNNPPNSVQSQGSLRMADHPARGDQPESSSDCFLTLIVQPHEDKCSCLSAAAGVRLKIEREKRKTCCCQKPDFTRQKQVIFAFISGQNLYIHISLYQVVKCKSKCINHQLSTSWGEEGRCFLYTNMILHQLLSPPSGQHRLRRLGALEHRMVRRV